MWVRQVGAAVSGRGDSKGRPGVPVTTGYDGLGGERSAPLTLCQAMLPSRKTLGVIGTAGRTLPAVSHSP